MLYIPGGTDGRELGFSPAGKRGHRPAGRIVSEIAGSGNQSSKKKAVKWKNCAEKEKKKAVG